MLQIARLKYLSKPCHSCHPNIDDNIDETYGVNVQFESDEEVSSCMFLIVCNANAACLFIL